MPRLNLTLDHVGIVNRDLESVSLAYARLGFRLTLPSLHTGRLRLDGPVETWGSGNRCAMFRDGYLELLGVVDPLRYHDQLVGPLARYEGAHLLALGARDIEVVRSYWQEVSGKQLEVSRVGRDVPQLDGGSKPAEFAIVFIGQAVPEAVLFAIEHKNPDVLWQPDLLNHPNGVEAIRGVTLVAADPVETTARLRALIGTSEPRAGVRKASLTEGGWIEVLSPSEAFTRFPGSTVPQPPSIMSVTYRVACIGDTGRYLANAGVSINERNEGLWISSAEAAGCICEFVTSEVEDTEQ